MGEVVNTQSERNDPDRRIVKTVGRWAEGSSIELELGFRSVWATVGLGWRAYAMGILNRTTALSKGEDVPVRACCEVDTVPVFADEVLECDLFRGRRFTKLDAHHRPLSFFCQAFPKRCPIRRKTGQQGGVIRTGENNWFSARKSDTKCRNTFAWYSACRILGSPHQYVAHQQSCYWPRK